MLFRSSARAAPAGSAVSAEPEGTGATYGSGRTNSQVTSATTTTRAVSALANRQTRLCPMGGSVSAGCVRSALSAHRKISPDQSRRVAPTYGIESTPETRTPAPGLAASTIRPLPMYMATWLIGE